MSSEFLSTVCAVGLTRVQHQLGTAEGPDGVRFKVAGTMQSKKEHFWAVYSQSLTANQVRGPWHGLSGLAAPQPNSATAGWVELTHQPEPFGYGNLWCGDAKLGGTASAEAVRHLTYPSSKAWRDLHHWSTAY